MSSLTDKLRAMGVHLVTEKVPPPQHSAAISLEQIMDGNFQSTEFGEIFLTEKTIRKVTCMAGMKSTTTMTPNGS